MSIKCKYISLQEIGKRANQEDSLYPSVGQEIPDNDLFILCDGMGGHDCGEVASQTVCDAMSSFIKANPDTDFESALDAAYDALDAADNSSLKKMGTTMTLVKLDNNACIVAHIGDSRVYHIRPSEKRILYVTRDHSLVNDLVACGEMTEEEAKHSSQKNVITRAMQPHQAKRTKADVAILTDIHEGDYFYMCSDGMLEISEDEDIVNVLSMNVSDQEKVEILRGVTKDNSDNHTAHLIRISSVVYSEPEVAVPDRQCNLSTFEKSKAGKHKCTGKRVLKTFLILLLAVGALGLAGFFWIKAEKPECEMVHQFLMMFRDSTENMQDSILIEDVVMQKDSISLEEPDMVNE
jgi:protein phosphatase